MQNPQIRRNLTPRQAALRENDPPDRFLMLRTRRDANRIPLELAARVLLPYPVCLLRVSLSKDRNETGAGPNGPSPSITRPGC